MKGPYENVLLGAFIFRLGYKMGESGKLKNTTFAANLFQQTPLDAAFSDFMGTSKARGFLLEFKKSWDDRVSELAKNKFKLLQEPPTLVAQAEKCHLFGYGKDLKDSQTSGNIDIVFGTYPEVVSAKNEEALKVRWPMSDFLAEIIDEKIGANPTEFRDYITELLERLKRRHKESTASKRLFANAELGALASAAGVVAILNTGNALYALPLVSIIDLGVNLQIIQAEELRQEIEPPYEHSHGIDIEKPSRTIDMETDEIDFEKYPHGIDKERRSHGIDRRI
jgi:hypothetical protein